MFNKKKPTYFWQLPIWLLGFRPFFLLGSAFSALALGIWIVKLLTSIQLNLPANYFDLPIWHAHEMIYGFGVAIVAGFVLTAIQNWTGIPGINGKKLFALTVLWTLGRVAVFFTPSPIGAPSQVMFAYLTAAIDLAFLPTLTLFLFPFFKSPEVKVERIFILYFSLFFFGNLITHMCALGLTPTFGLDFFSSRQGLILGLNTLLLVIILMGGRVIPFFTEGTLTKFQPKSWVPIEWAAPILTWLFLSFEFLFVDGIYVGISAFLCSGIHAIRLGGWYAKRIKRVAILWVLHLAYLWVVVGFLLRGLSAFGLLNRSVAVHAFTVGGLGMIIYGMITRVSLGHTGRPLKPHRAIIASYVLMNLAAILRVFGVWFATLLESSLAIRGCLALASVLWIISFGVFIYIYGPILWRPRLIKKIEF